MCLPDGRDRCFDSFTVSGWGHSSFQGEHNTKLHHIDVPLIPDAKCRKQTELTEQKICAGNLDNGGVDSCQGDSGGPLTWMDPITNKVKLIGVVSYGSGW